MKRTKKLPLNQALSFLPSHSASDEIRDVLREKMELSLLAMVDELFQQELRALCGERYEHGKSASCKRAGSEKGSIYWDGQRKKISRPRVRDTQGEVSLEVYQALRDYDLLSDEVLKLVIRGISTRDYSDAVCKMETDLGLSKSSVSRAFQHGSKKDLDDINGRDLSQMQFCAMMIDGVEKAGLHVIVALGFSTDGRKVILGLRQGATENKEVVKDLLQSLLDRNLATTDEVLFVLDGAKALKSAVQSHFGKRAIIQRCQEHKIRNVLSYLPKQYHSEAERRLRAAYGMKTEAQARQALEQVRAWLKGLNEEAARSLQEGLEETITVHKLKLPEILRKTFKSSNPIESVFDKVEYRRNRVKRWKNETQQLRWVASSLVLHEKKFRRIRGYQELPLLIDRLTKMKLDKQTSAA